MSRFQSTDYAGGTALIAQLNAEKGIGLVDSG